MPGPVLLSPIGSHVLAFDALELFGAIIFLALILTVFFSRGRIHRTGAWYSFCLSWVISGLSYTLLFIAGYHTRSAATTKQEFVSFGLCSFQAALIYAVPILCSSSSLALIGSIYLDIRTVVPYTNLRGPAVGNWLLLVLPYFFFIPTFLGYLGYSLANPALVYSDQRNGAYCSLAGGTYAKVSGLITAVLTVLCIAGEGVIIRRLVRDKGMVRNGVVSMQLVIRLLLFSLLGVAVLLASLIIVLGESNPILLDIMLGIFPAAGSLIFALQQDILQTWRIIPTKSTHPTTWPSLAGLSMDGTISPTSEYVLRRTSGFSDTKSARSMISVP